MAEQPTKDVIDPDGNNNLTPENHPSADEKNPANEPDIFVPDDVRPFIKNLPENEQKAVLAIIRSSWRGPLPPPAVLKGYNEVISGGAERIFKMAENQSQHRISMEKEVIAKEQRQSAAGQIFGFIIAVAFGASAFVLAYTGHEVSGTIIGTVDLVALVSVFVLGKKWQGNTADIDEHKD